MSTGLRRVYRNGGMDATKDEANPRSNESGRHKRQALADRKDIKIKRQCMGKSGRK